MKKLLLLSSIAAFAALLSPSRVAAQGEANPTGVAGIFNGNVQSGGSYDPMTANAMRIVDDIVVPGTVGAYPLKWTRYFNSRSINGWTFSYAYGLTGGMTFPDGREIKHQGLDFPPDPTGYEERIGTSAIKLGDGGKVMFGTFGTVALPIQLIDPYGQITTLTRDSYNKLTRARGPLSPDQLGNGKCICWTEQSSRERAGVRWRERDADPNRNLYVEPQLDPAGQHRKVYRVGERDLQ
jgi:hypothetical protein